MNAGRGGFGGRRGGCWTARSWYAPRDGHGDGGNRQPVVRQMQNPAGRAHGSLNPNNADGAGDRVAVSLNLPTEAAALLKQAFASAQGTGGAEAGDNVCDKLHDEKDKEAVTIEPIKTLSKLTSSKKPESSKQGADKQGGKPPYCWRCFTRGHGAVECIEPMYCPICDCKEHTNLVAPSGGERSQWQLRVGTRLRVWVFSKSLLPLLITTKMIPEQLLFKSRMGF
jgi:hypothetical protein